MKRDAFTYPLDLGNELIIDNFAGGGGTSTGLEAAFGRPVDIAINHDPEALAMHALNHPKTKHLCESVWDVDPIVVTQNRPVGLVWLSPDCKHFSKAKGGTPVAKHIRGLAWVGMRWVALTKPRVLMLENVEEFKTWGPLIIGKDGKAYPDPKRKGKTFNSFVRQLREHGYTVDWRELRACDNGAPTIRKRLFLVARRDGLPIVFPEQSHGDPTSREVLAGMLSPFRTAAECIDFDLPAESIFDRKKELAVNTQRRVAKGLWRHVLASAKPFIVTNTSGHPGAASDQPLPTITTGNHHMLGQPVLTPLMTSISSAGGWKYEPNFPTPPATAERPHDFHCTTCGNTFPSWQPEDAGIPGACPTCGNETGIYPIDGALTAPFLTEHANASNQRTMPADEPLRTICAQVKGGHFSVVAPTLAPLRGTSEGHLSARTVEQPMTTISAGGTHHALAGAHLITIGYGERAGQEPRTQTIKGPLGTAVAGGVKQALVATHITKFRTDSAGSDMHKPMPTVTANSYIKRPGGSAPLGVVAAHLTHLTHHGERAGSSPAQPLPTVTGAHRGEQALIAANLIDIGHGESCGTGAKRWSRGVRSVETPLNSVTASSVPSAIASTFLEQANGGFWADNDGHPMAAPVSTIASKGANQRLVTACLVKYYSSGGQWQAVDEPMHTLPTKARMGLVETIQVPADCLAEEHREKARRCAELLHEHLPEHFPAGAEMILMSYDGILWVLADITLRMLKARELFRAQAFPDNYIIHEIPDPKLLFKDGVQVADPLSVPRIPLSTTAQIRMCGNSVSPVQAEALVRANFGHERMFARTAA